MQSFASYLFESINDKHILKAVFLAGGPGSGKSFISNIMFEGLGARVVNSDTIFEYLLKSDPNYIPGKQIKVDTLSNKNQREYRERAKIVTANRTEHYLSSMIPIIYDMTGKNYNTVKQQYDVLQSRGYDCAMVFIDTTLDVALYRNAYRERSIPDDVVVDIWTHAHNNIDKYRALFSPDFTLVENSVKLDKAEVAQLSKQLFKIAKKFIESPNKNQLAKNIISTIKEKKQKYTDVSPEHKANFL